MDASSLHQLLASLNEEQLLALPIDIIDIIASDRTLITYRPKLNDLTGSVTATILLQQIMYWWAQKKRPFYKFKEPCKHPDYRAGDSWTEELGFSRHEFNTALKKIGAKISRKLPREEAAQHALVFYWTDMSRKTWYEINEARLRLRLIQLYRSDPYPISPSPEGKTPSESRKAENRINVKPQSGVTKSEKPDNRKSAKRPDEKPEAGSTIYEEAATGDDAIPPYPTPESGARNSTETNAVEEPEVNPAETPAETPPPPKPRLRIVSSREGDGEQEEEEVYRAEVSRIAKRLEAEGIYPAPAQEIAAGALRRGVDEATLLVAFRAHLAQTGRIELATWRLKEGILDLPDDEERERKLTQQAFMDLLDEPNAPPPEPARSPPAAPPEPLLWERVLTVLRDQMTQAAFDRYLRDSRQLLFEGGLLVVLVSTSEAREWLEGPRHKQVLRALNVVEDEAVETVRFVIDPPAGGNGG